MNRDAGAAAEFVRTRLGNARNDQDPQVAVADQDMHVERLPLTVPVRSPDDPSGVDLSDVLAAVQAVSPSVRGIAVRDDTLTVISDRPVEGAELGKLTTLLADSDRLARSTRPKKAAVTATDLARVLLDDATGDREWLRAFRQYAVTHLIPREEKPE